MKLRQIPTLLEFWMPFVNIRFPAMQKSVLIAVVCQAIVLQGCTETVLKAPANTLPILLGSSPDFGYLRSDSGGVSRIVKIRNSSSVPIQVAHWKVSCECLRVVPSSLDFQPGESTYIRLLFDPSKEGDGFVGDLMISVEAFMDRKQTCKFAVPVSVIAPRDVKHLEELEH